MLALLIRDNFMELIRLNVYAYLSFLADAKPRAKTASITVA
jgi:hypothetical protein